MKPTTSVVNKGTLEERTQFFDAHTGPDDKNRAGVECGSLNTTIEASQVVIGSGEPALYLRFKTSLGYFNEFSSGFALSFDDVQTLFGELGIKSQRQLDGKEVIVHYFKPEHGSSPRIYAMMPSHKKSPQ